jgi:hypothetical protein
MMRFTKRHEQELAEIKAVTRELDQRAQASLRQLRRINGGDAEAENGAPNRPVDRRAADSAPATDPTEPRDEGRPEARGRLREGLRRLVYGPEVEMPSSTRTEPAPAPDERHPHTAVSDGETDGGSEASGNGDVPVVAFVHIPKTAGGTVTSMLAAAYSKRGLHKAGNYVRGPETAAKKLAKRPGGWDSWQRKGGRVSVGHVPYGVFREHMPPGTLYMTFLREPVDRVLSHYHRHIGRRDPSRAGRPGKRGRVKADSIEEALVEMRLPQINNLATRFLCGHPSPLGELPDSALEDAKANLREFAFVGIQERFDESLSLLHRTFGFDLVPPDAYENRHVSSDRPAVDEIPQDERALIVECNQLDIDLYTFGLELFEDAITAAGEGPAGERHQAVTGPSR